MSERILNYIPTRYMSIKITMTNGKLFPDGKNYVIFNCNSTVIGDDIKGGGFTAQVNINKNNELLNNTASVTLFGTPEPWQDTMDKLQSLTGIVMVDNDIVIYMGYKLNANGLPDIEFHGRIESGLPDWNDGKEAFIITAKGYYAQNQSTTANPIDGDESELLTTLFDRIIDQGLDNINITQLSRVYKINNINTRYAAANSTYNEASMIEQLKHACRDNGCKPPQWSGDTITIVANDWIDLDTTNILTLDENNIIGYPLPGSGNNQGGLNVRFNGGLTLLRKIRIIGDSYPKLFTQQEWYINSLQIIANNRGKEWMYQIGLGTFPNNLPINSLSNSNTNQSSPDVSVNLKSVINNQLDAADTLPSAVTEEQDSSQAKNFNLFELQGVETNLANLLYYVLSQWSKIINTAIICEVVKADNEKNLYTIRELTYLINENNTKLKPRTVRNVPAMFPPFLDCDLYEGDKVQVVCNQYDITRVKKNQYKAAFVGSRRRLSLSDCVIVGKPKELNKNDNKIKLTEKSAKFTFKEDITFDVQGTIVNITKDHVKITRGESSATLEDTNIDLKCGLAELIMNASGIVTLGSTTRLMVMADTTLATANQINISGLGQGQIAALTLVLTKLNPQPPIP